MFRCCFIGRMSLSNFPKLVHHTTPFPVHRGIKSTALHPANSISGPQQELQLASQSLHVYSLTPDRLPAAYSLLSDAAKRSDNVGVDEYPTSEHFATLIACSDASVCLVSAVTDRVEGLVVVSPCVYARSSRPIICNLLIATTREISDEISSWTKLIDVAMETARRIPAGRYRACVVDVFVTCVERLLAFRRQGFLVVGCVPNAGKLAGFSKGYVANYILYRDLENELSAMQVSSIINMFWLDLPISGKNQK